MLGGLESQGLLTLPKQFSFSKDIEMDIIGQKNLRTFWEELALCHTDKVCVIGEDENGNTVEYTYGELNKEINRYPISLLRMVLPKAIRSFCK